MTDIEEKISEFAADNKRKLWLTIYAFIALVWLPVGNYIVFAHGWSNEVASWPIVIIEPILALGWAFLSQLDLWNSSRKTQAVRVLATYFVVFMLSATAIIYGWGMHPKNWIVIITYYVIACALPPFDQVSYDLIWWRREKEDKEIDLLRQERTYLRRAVFAMEESATSGPEKEKELIAEYTYMMNKANEIKERLASL